MSDQLDEAAVRIALMQADIENKGADTSLKREQLRWEPVKAMSAAFGAGVAVATSLIALGGWLFAHLH